MVLETIYIVRHGYRTSWTVDPISGTYHSSIRTPTGIPSDPALASYGLKQAEELATHLLSLKYRIDLIYSSPYYRCLQTLAPYTERLAAESSPSSSGSGAGPGETAKAAPVKVNIEPGLGEFYGRATFTHPRPAPLSVLSKHFSHLSEDTRRGPIIEAAELGESIEQLHDRVAYCFDELIRRVDEEFSTQQKPISLIACTHAATIIAAGRVLTGRVPEDVGEEDFRAFTCGISKFVRRKGGAAAKTRQRGRWSAERPDDIPDLGWRDGNGVGGGWDCVENSDCSFLSGGEERGWHFAGDEGFLQDPNAFNDAQNAADDTASGGGAGNVESKSRL